MLQWRGFVAHVSWRTVLPFPQTDLSHGFRDRDANAGVAVHDGDAHLNLGDFAVEVAHHQALAQRFYTMHLCFGAAPAVVAVPVSPECPTKIS